jgi:DNA-binding beta-propeller fold protein YncE
VAVSRDGKRICVVDTGGVESDRHGLWLYSRGSEGDSDGSARGSREDNALPAGGRFVGGRGAEPGRFNLPSDAGIASDGTLWVLDAGNFRVQALDAEGRVINAFGSPGNGLGELARPRGLAIGPDGLVYVADALLCNVQVFRPDGRLLLALGARAQDAARDQPGRYLLPARLACDEGSRLYVVDQYLHKVEVIRRLSDAEGQRLVQQGDAPG